MDGGRVVSLESEGAGYHRVDLPDFAPDERYFLRRDQGPWRPDPASRSQPDGVHGPSAFVPLEPMPAWAGVGREDLVFYELEVGSFTEEGTFDAAIPHLDRLADLGITAVEPMPVAEVGGAPRARNWGYDGVLPFCVRADFGGPHGFRRFVGACRARGMAVVLDVVYNHLGPEGNYLPEWGPVGADHAGTPWGPALNFDGAGSDGLRAWFLDHARFCFEILGVDGLRLDSVVSIVDRSEPSFLAELSERTDRLSAELGRPLTLVAEADDNARRWVEPRDRGGVGCHAMWTDDLHHAIHARLTGERAGFYADFGSVAHIARAFTAGACLEGGFSRYRGRRWGQSMASVAPTRLVVYAQNHDVVGNRPDGARIHHLLPGASARVAVALPLLSPFLPLVFMGQEHGDTAEFHFYTGFEDPALGVAVAEGRRSEARAFGWAAPPRAPQDPATHRDSVLQGLSSSGDGWLALHRAAIALGRALRRQGRPRLLGLGESPGWFAVAWPDGHRMLTELDGGAPGFASAGAIVFDTDPGGTGPRLRVFAPTGG